MEVGMLQLLTCSNGYGGNAGLSRMWMASLCELSARGGQEISASKTLDHALLNMITRANLRSAITAYSPLLLGTAL